MRFTFFTAVSAALLLADTQTVFVQEQLYAQIEGEGHSSADMKATAMTGAEIEAEIQAEADAEAELCARAAATDLLKNITDTISVKWPKSVQNGWNQIVKGVRGINQTSTQDYIDNKNLGQTPFESLMYDYTDHCALSEKPPLSFKEWFNQVTFYQGHGDWYTWEQLEKAQGNTPAMDSYIVKRVHSRTELRIEELENLAKKVDAVVAEATKVGKPASAYLQLMLRKDGKIPQTFLDAVAANKDNKNVLGNMPGPIKYPNINDVDLNSTKKDKTLGKALIEQANDENEDEDPVDGEKGDAEVEKKNEE